MKMYTNRIKQFFLHRPNKITSEGIEDYHSLFNNS